MKNIEEVIEQVEKGKKKTKGGIKHRPVLM